MLIDESSSLRDVSGAEVKGDIAPFRLSYTADTDASWTIQHGAIGIYQFIDLTAFRGGPIHTLFGGMHAK